MRFSEISARVSTWKAGFWIFLALFVVMMIPGLLAFLPYDPSLPGKFQIIAFPSEAFLFFGILLMLVSTIVAAPGPWWCVACMLVSFVFATNKAQYAFVHRTLITAGLYPDPIIHSQSVNPNFGKIVVFFVAFLVAGAVAAWRPSLERGFIMVAGVALLLTTGAFHTSFAYSVTMSRHDDLLRLMRHVVRDEVDDAQFATSCAAFEFECFTAPYSEVRARLENIDSYYVTSLYPLVESLPRNPRVVTAAAILDNRSGNMHPSAAAAFPLGDGRVRVALDHHMMRFILMQGEWAFNFLATAAYATWGPGLAILMLVHGRRRSARMRTSPAARSSGDSFAVS